MIEQNKSIAVYSTMAAIVTVLLLWIAVSTMDYDDATREQAEYCQHVRDGLWPDYKGSYNKVCEEEL
ncbi:MAG: hypothetical protein IPK48_06765 [Gammaproteobacteria bacterium]|nr:hypothetical protein [Gammaproteobacteria bacterium]